MRKFAELEVPILCMLYSLIFIAAIGSFNILRDLASYIRKHEVSSYVFCYLSNSRVAKR